MAKKNSDEYWKQREQDEQDWINENVKNDDDFNEHLQEYYQELIDRINKDISNQLIQYAEAEGVNLSKARQRVSDEDVKAFENKAKSIVKKAEKIRKRKGFVSRSDFSKEINARLRLYNATMRINRLEMLKAQIGLEIMDTNLDVHDDVDQRLSNDYLGELKRQAGILAMYESQHNYKDVAKVIMAQTKNATFSERIWANTDVLKANLDRELTQAIIRGENPRKLASRLRKYVAEGVGNVTNVTERIARTESARVLNKAQIESFKKAGYEKCKWVAEGSACKICRGYALDNDGIFDIKDLPVWPVHPNCMCSTTPWYDKEE